MTKLLLFKDILATVLDEAQRGVVLLGEPQFVRSNGQVYDVLYHVEAGVDLATAAAWARPSRFVRLVVPCFRAATVAELNASASKALQAYPSLKQVALVGPGSLEFCGVERSSSGLRFRSPTSCFAIGRELFYAVAGVEDERVERRVQQGIQHFGRLAG